MADWKIKLLPGWLLAAVGGVGGAITGWLALLTGKNSAGSVLDFGAGLYPWLALLLPLALLALAYHFRYEETYSYGRSFKAAAATWLSCAALGAILASLAFALLAALIPSSLGQAEASAILPNYLAALGWASFGLVLATSCLAALVIGIWYSR